METLNVETSLESLERIAARKPIQEGPDKFSKRRIELAKAALETLATLGYARTSLREIAQNTRYSHGVLHYYFSDKLDLITCCVSYYKSICVTRYDDVVTDATSADQLLEGFVTRLEESIENEAPLHRLWYDLRAQALFEEAFSTDIGVIDSNLRDMVWRVCEKYCALSGGVPALSRNAVYAVFDGLIQKALFDFVQGKPDSVRDLIDEVRALLPKVVKLA